jgi:hypothetical protein
MIEVGWGRSRGTFREVFARLLLPGEAGEQIARWEDLQRRTATRGDADGTRGTGNHGRQARGP